MSGLALILPLRRIFAAPTLNDLAATVRAIADRHPVVCGKVATAFVPGLGMAEVVHVRMLDGKGPTEICAVALGRHSRDELEAALRAGDLASWPQQQDLVA